MLSFEVDEDGHCNPLSWSDIDNEDDDENGELLRIRGRIRLHGAYFPSILSGNSIVALENIILEEGLPETLSEGVDDSIATVTSYVLGQGSTSVTVDFILETYNTSSQMVLSVHNSLLESTTQGSFVSAIKSNELAGDLHFTSSVELLSFVVESSAFASDLSGAEKSDASESGIYLGFNDYLSTVTFVAFSVLCGIFVAMFAVIQIRSYGQWRLERSKIVDKLIFEANCKPVVKNGKDVEEAGPDEFPNWFFKADGSRERISNTLDGNHAEWNMWNDGNKSNEMKVCDIPISAVVSRIHSESELTARNLRVAPVADLENSLSKQ